MGELGDEVMGDVKQVRQVLGIGLASAGLSVLVRLSSGTCQVVLRLLAKYCIGATKADFGSAEVNGAKEGSVGCGGS